MAAKYIKLFYDWAAATSELSFEEKGRLIDAMIAYATGQPVALSGNERFVFPAFRAQIDRDKESYERISEQNRNNARCRWDRRLHADACDRSQDKDKEKEKDEDKDQDKEQEQEAPPTPSGAHAAAAAAGSDGAVRYAQENLNAFTPGHAQELCALAADMPEDMIRHAIDETTANGSRSWSYTRRILRRYRDQGFKALPDVLSEQAGRANRQPTNPRASPAALSYSQRDYSNTNLDKSIYYDLGQDDEEGGPPGPTSPEDSAQRYRRDVAATSERSVEGAADKEGGPSGPTSGEDTAKPYRSRVAATLERSERGAADA